MEAAHIEKIFQVFANGNTAHYALYYANDQYPIPDPYSSRDEESVPLTLVGGDSYATFSHVYLPPAIRDEIGDPPVYPYWFWVPVGVP